MKLRQLSQCLLLIFCLINTVVSNAADNKQKQTQKTSINTADKSPSQEKNEKYPENPPYSQPRILHIGSGAVGGNYFVLGELVGAVISHPLGSLPCKKGGTCGIDGLQAVNLSSSGSVSNLNHLQTKMAETVFAQSDIAYWAYTGTGLYDSKDKMSKLRAIASLYPESMHIIVRKDSQITDISQLSGKRVSVGDRKSGTLQSARLVLSAYKLSEDDMKTEYLNNQQSLQKLKAGELDAVFFTVGAPAPAFEQLFNNDENYTLLSIGEAEQKDIFKQGHYFSPYTIASGTYKNIPEIKTISVYALWLTTTDATEQKIYQLTKALWTDTAKQIFKVSHIGEKINIENSLKGIGIPLHSGAKKYYNEIGKRF